MVPSVLMHILNDKYIPYEQTRCTIKSTDTAHVCVSVPRAVRRVACTVKCVQKTVMVGVLTLHVHTKMNNVMLRIPSSCN